MQPSKNKKIFTILGVLFMAIAGGTFFWYEWAGGRELINYTDVIVLKEDALKGQEINKSHLAKIKVEKTAVIEDAIVKQSLIIGKEASHFIPANTQLHTDYFEEAGLVLKEGQVVAQIPVEWTLSVPDTLRRGDNIIIYSALYDKELLNSLQPSKNNQTNTTKTENTSGNTEKEEEEQSINSSYTTIAETNQLEEVLSATVAYVKDSANQEVVTLSHQDRLNASSVISNFEILTTPGEFKKIEGKINQGGKLIIMYSDKEKIGDIKQ